MSDVNFFSPDGGTTRYLLEDTEARSGIAGQQSLLKDTVGWTGKNRAYSQENNAVIADIESGVTYNVSWTGSATVTLKKDSSSGTEITSGSTSPLTFTADADYDLYFGSSADVTQIMVCDSALDGEYENYHESVEQTLRDAEVIEGKNKLISVFEEVKTYNTNGTWNGNVFTSVTGRTFTCVVNEDGYITQVTVNGSSATRDNFWIMREHSIVSNGLVLSGAPNTSSASTYKMQIINSDSLGYDDLGSSVNIPSGVTLVSALIIVYADAAPSNAVFAPMVCTLEEWQKSHTYEPYYVPLKDSKFNRSEQAVLGAKNLLENTATTQTVSGAAFTVNADGSVKINRTTATANYADLIISETYFEKGTQVIVSANGMPASETARLIFYYKPDYTKLNHMVASNANVNKVVVIPESGIYQSYIRVMPNMTVSNTTVYPMIRLASDPDDTYVPFAMTNRELTEKVTPNITDITSALNNIFSENVEVATLTRYGKMLVLSARLNTITSAISSNYNLSSITPKPLNTYLGMISSLSISGTVWFDVDRVLHIRTTAPSASAYFDITLTFFTND